MNGQAAAAIREELAALYAPIVCEVCGKSIIHARKEIVGSPQRFRWRCACGEVFPPIARPKHV